MTDIPLEPPEHFYTLVGRVVVKAAKLETALASTLMQVLYGPPTPETATGKFNEQYSTAYQAWHSAPGSMIADELEKKVDDRLPERTEFSAHVAACKALLDDRHGIVHSIWVALGHDEWVGVRSLRPKKSEPDRPSAAGVRASELWLRQKLDRVEELHNWTRVWHERIEAAYPHGLT